MYCIYAFSHIFIYACVNFSSSIMLIFLLHTAPRARLFFLPCYPSNEWGSSPVGQSEISMMGRHSISLLYMAFARQMRWTGDVSIIITLNWEKHIRVVKLCMTFESGPEWIETLFWALYDLLLIQCILSSSMKIEALVHWGSPCSSWSFHWSSGGSPEAL